MKITLIAAVAPGGVIGSRQDLPWRLSADLKRFKRVTMGHHLLVGRKTWETIGRALPGRRMLVVSRQELALPEGCELAGSIEEALSRAVVRGEEELFVAGGGEIYAQTVAVADRLQLTRVHGEYAGDTFFPEIDPAEWELAASDDHPADDRNEVPLTFETWERRRDADHTD